MKTSVSAVTPSPLLGPILPDEMVWHYFGRFLARFPTLSLETMAGLLGDEYPSHRKTFPSRLANLATAFGFPGAPDLATLIHEHTFFPFAQPEITAVDAERLARTMSIGRFPVGAPDSLLLRADFKLRICPACLASHSIPYLRRCHQVPTLRICTTHKTPLLETEVRAGTKDPVALARTVEGTPLDVVDGKGQLALAAAYHWLATSTTQANGEQVRHEFARTLERRGHFSNRQVQATLTELLCRAYQSETMAAVGGEEHSVRLMDWLTVPRIALALAVLDEPFDAFLLRASLSAPPVAWGSRRQTALARDRARLCQIEVFAPEAAKRIKSAVPFRRITRWALARELNRFLGGSFASNYSYREEIADKLDCYVESNECYANRVIDGIVEDPSVCEGFDSFRACMGAFGLGRYMARNPDTAQQARRLFNEAHGRDER